MKKVQERNEINVDDLQWHWIVKHILSKSRPNPCMGT